MKVRYADDHPFFRHDLLCKDDWNFSCFYNPLLESWRQRKQAKFPGFSTAAISISLQWRNTSFTTRQHTGSRASVPLPSPRLLDLHVREVHDNFFRAQNERTAIFECLVEKCPHKFFTHKDRGDHLSMHLYPPEFNDIIIGKKYVKQKSKKRRKVDEAAEVHWEAEKSKEKECPRSSRRRQKPSL